MRKLITFVIAIIFLTTFVTAGITLNSQVFSVYNLGDKIEIPINIIGDPEINDLLTINLKCNNQKTEVYREYISLDGEEKTRDITIPLIKNLIGESKGFCFVEYSLGSTTQNLTQQFEISNKILIELNDLKKQYTPGEKTILKGTAIKENNQGAKGVIEAQIIENDFESLIFSKIVKDGNFELEIKFPKNIKAGEHLLTLKVYEKNSNSVIINQGELSQQINIAQVPTNLEIFLKNNEIIPGNSLQGEIILHDQTGEKISEEAYISIRNYKGELVKKIKLTTSEEFNYHINSTEKPSEWKITAISEELTDERTIYLLENEKAEIEIINQTLVVTNVGNVFYNEEIKVKIGNETKTLNPELKVGESQKYLLTAPEGEYLVQIGKESQQMSLTGNAIDVREITKNPFKGFNILVWIFLLLVLGFATYLIIKKGYKRTFFGKKKSRKKLSPTKKEIAKANKKSNQLTQANNKAQMSLSISGNKQTATIVLLNLKNYSEIKSGEANVKETLQSIAYTADKHKILTYENNENFYFIFAPESTKTFKNQTTALKFSLKINEIIKKHNKLFKKKINYGIGIESGEIILKKEPEAFKFALMGSFLTNIKKIASASEEEALMSQIVKEKLDKNIRTEPKNVKNLELYSLKKITSKPDHSKFIKGFIERIERDKKQKNNSS